MSWKPVENEMERIDRVQDEITARLKSEPVLLQTLKLVVFLKTGKLFIVGLLVGFACTTVGIFVGRWLVLSNLTITN